MNPLTARWIFCSGLCFLTACAVLPEPRHVVTETTGAETPALTPEMTLAKVMRERAELSSMYGAQHPAMIEAAAAEASLRESAIEAGAPHFRRDLIRALSLELAEARRDQRNLAQSFGDRHPKMIRAQAAVKGLTAAINAEVRAG